MGSVLSAHYEEEEPLSLTDAQLHLILDHAKHVPPQWRSRWLSAVADRLCNNDIVTDCNVMHAIRFVNERIGVQAA